MPSEDPTHSVSFGAATGHVSEETHFFLREPSHVFHVVLDTDFEVVGEQAELATTSPELASGYYDPLEPYRGMEPHRTASRHGAVPIRSNRIAPYSGRIEA